MNRNLLVICFCTVLLTILPANCFGDFLLIDDFDSGEGSIELGPEQSGSLDLDIFGIDPSRTIGGERHIFLDGQATEIDSLLIVELYAPIGGGPFVNEIFGFNSFGVAGYRWGQNNDLNLAVDQLDLSATNIAAADNGLNFEVTVSMALTSGRGDANEVTESISKPMIDTDQTDLGLSWQADEFSNVDLSDVDVIELSFNGDNYRVNLDALSVNTVAVPEPGSMAILAAIGLTGLIRRKREGVLRRVDTHAD